MWINKNIVDRTVRKNKPMCGKVTQTGNTTVNIQSEKQCVELPIIAPWGVAYVPKPDTTTVIMPLGDGDGCIGTVVEDRGLKPGEVMLYSAGGATLILKNDGTIVANGKVIA